MPPESASRTATQHDGQGEKEYEKTPDTGNTDAAAIDGAGTVTDGRGGGGGAGGGAGDPLGDTMTLTYETSGGSTIAPEEYPLGTTVQLNKTPAKEGFFFTGW